MPIGVETERFRAESLSEGTHTSLYVRQCGHACVYALLTYTVPAISYISLSSVDPRTPNRNLPTKSLNGLGSQFPGPPMLQSLPKPTGVSASPLSTRVNTRVGARP